MTIYVFGEPSGLIVKIGVSNRWEEREKALRRFWKAGEILHIEHRGTALLERRVHRLLKDRFWIDGEWFACGAAVAISAVRHVVRSSVCERRLMPPGARKRRHLKRAFLKHYEDAA